jgi:hypothetical protein
MFSSAIQVINRSASEMMILDPPYYTLGGVFLVLSSALVLWILIVSLRSGFQLRILGFSALFALPPMVLGLVLVTGKTTTVFSRRSDTMIVDHRWLGIFTSRQQYPLTSVRRAVVEGGRGRTLAVLLEAGSPVVLASRTDRDGYYEAADAINKFLQHGRSSEKQLRLGNGACQRHRAARPPGRRDRAAQHQLLLVEV